MGRTVCEREHDRAPINWQLEAQSAARPKNVGHEVLSPEDEGNKETRGPALEQGLADSNEGQRPDDAADAQELDMTRLEHALSMILAKLRRRGRRGVAGRRRWPHVGGPHGW